MLTVTVHADEVLFRLDQIPARIRGALRDKFEQIFAKVAQDTFAAPPGKFVDPTTVKTGLDVQGSLLIGYIEATDKAGTYPILPVKASVLRFLARSGEIVFAKHVEHPFMKGAPIVAQVLRESKPWIIDELESAVKDAHL